MRTYSYKESPEKIKLAFSFLMSDFGYKLKEERVTNYGPTMEYVGNDLRVRLYYDYKDNFFYFKLIRGLETKYPNDHDRINIKAFYRIAEKYAPHIKPQDLQPDNDQYLESLQLNADLLKTHGTAILKGVEWL